MAKRKPLPPAQERQRSSLDTHPKVSSTHVQNRFGGVLDDLRTSGTIVIERHDRPAAVLLSVEEFARLRANASPARQLDMLSAEFDALVARMQTPEAASGVRKAFAASPKEMTAVLRATRKKASAKRKK